MKTSFGRLTALIGLIVLSTPVQGQDYDYLTYGGTVTITRYMGQATEVVVPSKINGVPVAAISDNAFQNCATLSSVAVSENIKSIGRHAFAGCTNLKAVTFYDGLTGIGDAAFSGCVSLTNLVLPNSVTSLGMAAFQGCTSLIRVNIPDRCRNLELAGYAHYKSPFSGCTNLQAIDAGPGNLAYSSREGVLFNKEQSRLIMCPEGKTGAYMVPNGIRSIWSQAFTGCGSLTSIAIPESVTNIECGDWYKKWYAPNFSGCGSLSSFEVNPANPVYSSREGVLFDKSHGALLRCPTGRTGTYVVPEDIKSIGSGASIFAFAGCAKLTAITIPESVTNITPFAFLDCSSLSIAPMPTNLTCIEHFVFAGCSNLVGASIPVRVTRIGGYAFSGCSSLTNMIIPGNVTEIGEYAFSACRGLTSVAIPGSVTNLWFAAFYQCIGLTNVTLGDGVTKLMADLDNAVGGPGGAGPGTFQGCTRLTSVTIGRSVTSIDEEAFAECTSLCTIIIPSSVTNIANDAFLGCASLTAIGVDAENPFYSSVDGMLFNKAQTSLLICPPGKTGECTIPEGVADIADYSFLDCANLTRVSIPESVVSVSRLAFIDCTNLSSIVVDQQNSCYSSSDGVLFDEYQTSLLLCPQGLTGSFAMPSSTKTVDSCSFIGCRRLTQVSFPEGLTNIGDTAFSGCVGLTSITIPNGLTVIGAAAFWGCTSLTNVTLPETLIEIQTYAFSRCNNLTSITIPNGVKIIRSAFMNCQRLTTISLPDSLTELGGAFGGCTSLLTVRIPDGVTWIWETFSGCTSLTNVIVGRGLVGIGNRTFAGCTQLENVFFEGNAPALSDDWSPAFVGATKAVVYYLPGATGWSSTFGGRPTAIWRPQIEPREPKLGTGGDQFGFNVIWARGKTVVVEAAPSLANPAWLPVSTNSLVDGSSYFSDAEWANYPARFYRVRAQ